MQNRYLIPLLATAVAAALFLQACSDQEPTPAGTDETPASRTYDSAGVVGWKTEDFQSSLDRGIAWLKTQSKDGVWFGSDGKGNSFPSVAHTALALAPIAASLPVDERRSDPLVTNGCAFLIRNIGEDGGVHMPGMPKYDNYFTSATLMALEIVDDPAYLEQRTAMRDFLVTLQRKEEGRIKGGFGYNTAGNADLSNSQFAIEALRGAGFPKDHPSMQEALAYLERVQNRSENPANKDAVYEMEDKEKGKIKVVPGNDGSAGYEPGVSKAGMHLLPDGTYVPRGYGSMTYALLKCYILVGVKPDDARVKAVIDWVGKNYTWDENPGFRETATELKQPDAPYWGLYYYYMTAAKALRVAGVGQIDTPLGKRDWRKDLALALIKRQREDGSWINDQSKRWEEADPVITTGYALIALQEING